MSRWAASRRGFHQCLLAGVLAPATLRADPLAPLRVEIEAPDRGVVHEGAVVEVVARVNDPALTEALLSVHGVVYEVPVRDGRLQQNIVVLPGQNRVGVVVRRGAERAQASSTFFVQREGVELMVLVGWSSRREIIDLWVREPNGETCKWDHRSTEEGGTLLDFSADAIGFGSQGYLAPTVQPGRYRLKIHYWSDEARREEGQSIETLLDALNDAEAALRAHSSAPHREAVEAARRALERWAEPAGVQTPVHADVLLFANTPFERRWHFELIAQRTGQLQSLGEIEISEAMLREARAVR